MADEAKALLEANVPLVARIDPADIVQAMDNDELVLQFVCQMLALSHSSELRDRLKERLSDEWSDEEYVG